MLTWACDKEERDEAGQEDLEPAGQEGHHDVGAGVATTLPACRARFETDTIMP